MQSQNLVPVGEGLPESFGIYSETVAFNGNLYAADGLHIYRWNGNTWEDLEIEVDYNIISMTVFKNKLVVGLEISMKIPLI